MAIENTTRKTAVMQGDGISVKFPFSFRIGREEDLVVYVKKGLSAFQEQILNTDYELTDLITDSNGNITGGNIKYPKIDENAEEQPSPLTDEDYIYAIRETPRNQLETSEQVSFKSKDIERGLDKACMQIQELTEDVSRCIKTEEWQDIDPDEIIEAIYDAVSDAGNYANSAQNSANDASGYATNASNSSSSASTSATNSQKWAEGSDADVSPLGGTHSSKGWADEASSSATTAANAVTSCQTITNTAVASINRPLLSFIWSDHLINNQAWLRADTFSWQDGTVYSNAYNHLVTEFDVTKPIEVDTINGISIYYRTSADGHKIVLADGEQDVINLYNATGVAWYYVLDTVNQRFKLPRTKYGFTGLRNNVGDYVAPGLPNITGGISGIVRTQSGSIQTYGALNWTEYRVDSDGGESRLGGTIGFNAANSNSLYGNATTVQPPATQMYLYFYVGNFSQSATEQTAGLNTELFADKVDLDAANLNNSGKSMIANLGMPSDTYEDLILGASGDSYIAPADGYYTIAKYTTGNQYTRIINFTNNLNIECRQTNSGALCCVFLPVKKGDTVFLHYDAAGTTVFFKFIYAVGSEWEA